ncbi:MAG: dihydrolipoamide acetyltransferase family protein [Solirubrobacteraceae bacterium]|nr:MAG: 2-oxo acid dehydrogenase subunit E2 [Solirubrobacterales bacterium]
MADVVMPRLSDSMEEGTILHWLKAEGDRVRRGEEIVEIETDKATMTYAADADGVLAIVASEGDTLPIGAVIAHLGDTAGNGGGEALASTRAEEGAVTLAVSASAAKTPRSSPAQPSPPPDRDGRKHASPVARRMAADLGVELADVEGSGPGGRVVKADVEAASQTAAPAPTAPTAPPTAEPAPGTAKGAVRIEELSRTQQTIARRMAESRATVPDFLVNVEIDMEGAVELRSRWRAAAELLGEDRIVPSLNDMVVKACALALRDFPRANGAYRDGHFELYERVNVGVAVAAEDALVVPVIVDADARSLEQIAREAAELAERVRARTITPPELAGATFTVSNLGMLGVHSFTAVINPPQAAILAVGAVEQRAVVRDGELVSRHVVTMTLACDHRILYGADGARFLGRVRELLEAPLALTL